jgi:membrane-associated protease RseP (regulator of RpoE activity)
MALSLNLLHEEIAQEIQRKRDPLKIGLYIGGCIASLLLAYYILNVWQTLAIKSRLSAVERGWATVEPKVTAAQKRAAELNNIVNTTKVLDGMIDTRFFWAPLFGKIAGCVAPNVQLTSLDGGADESKGVSVSLDGVAAGREPRAEAEDFRQMLIEQLRPNWLGIKSEPPRDAGEQARGGVVVTEVLPSSLAADAGVRSGDVITAVNGHPVKDYNALMQLGSDLKTGDAVELLLSRSNRAEKVKTVAKQIPAGYRDLKVEFKTLEDLDSIANVGGVNMPMAHFTLNIEFNPYPAAKPAAAPARSKKSAASKNEDKAE